MDNASANIEIDTATTSAPRKDFSLFFQ